MKTKKLLALGLLSAMAVTTMSGTSVFAASPEAGGSTNVTYTPGQSTGTDPDTGDVADWTVDYPVKVVLNDSTINYGSGVNMHFSLLNTKQTGAATDSYTGNNTVKVSLVKHANSDGTNGIKMLDNSSAQQKVVMTMGSNASTQFSTNADTQIGTLSKDPGHELTIKAWLKDKSGAQKDKNYTQTLTWKFVQQ